MVSAVRGLRTRRRARRWLGRGKDTFDVVQSIPDQSVEGSQASEGRHGQEEGRTETGETSWNTSYIHESQAREIERGNSLGQKQRVNILLLSLLRVCSLFRKVCSRGPDRSRSRKPSNAYYKRRPCGTDHLSISLPPFRSPRTHCATPL